MNSRSFRGCHLWLPGLSQTLWGDWEDSWPRLGYFTFRKWTVGKKRTRIRREWWIFHLFCGVCLYGILKEEVLVDQTGGILRFWPVSLSKVFQSAAWASTWESRKHIWMSSQIGDWFGEDMSPVVVHNLCRSSLMTTKKQRSYLEHQTVSIIPDLFIEMALQFCSSRFLTYSNFHETSFLTSLASANSWELASETWKLTTSPWGVPHQHHRGILLWTPWSLRIWVWALQADKPLPKNRFGADDMMWPGAEKHR